MMKRLFIVLVLSSLSAQAQTITETFGSGANQFSIEFVAIGNSGNNSDSTGYGAVSYNYNIGIYEINRVQINKMSQAVNTGYAVPAVMADMRDYGGNGDYRPATGVSWYEAAKFVNWLNTSTGNREAYKFDSNGNFQTWGLADLGYDSTNLFRNSMAKYWLPSADEWYKAAAGSPSGNWFIYPTGSNGTPDRWTDLRYDRSIFDGPVDVTTAGVSSPWGTIGQGGNAYEWVESAFDGLNNSPNELREMRGGAWNSNASGVRADFRNNGAPEDESVLNGFRVASVPEPSALSLLLAGGAVLMAGRRRKSD